MRASALFALASTVAAAPIAVPNTFPAENSLLEERKIGLVANELTRGLCRPVIFIFARGTAEFGNMGLIVGPGVANQLKLRLGNEGVAVEGVPYDASFPANYLPGGTAPVSTAAMTALLILADEKCPDSVIVTGGYSQGAAVNHRAIESLPQRIKDKIKAVVLFGDTQKFADDNTIAGFNASKINFFCDKGRDLVCDGIIEAAILPPHLSYGSVAVEAGNWLADRV